MSGNDYVQTRCQKCGAQAWGHLSMTVACGTCGQPIAPMSSSPWNPASPYGVAQPPGTAALQQQVAAAQQAGVAPPGANAWQTPGASAMPNASLPAAVPTSSGGPSVNIGIAGFKVPFKLPTGGGKVKTGAAVVGVAALAVGGVIVSSKMKSHKSKPGTLSYSSLDMDVKKVDADRMIPAVTSTAVNWRKDAVFLSINLQAVHGDGTLDATGGGAQVEFVSPSRANGLSKKLREDAYKKFSFTASGVDYGDQYDGLEQANMPDHPPVPKCGVKNVLKQVKGLTGDKIVRITFDPQFNTEAWHVIGDDPKVDALYSIEDCSPVQP